MRPHFEPTRDDESYALLKASLRPPYRVEAEPRSEYYSQWLFTYKLYRGEELLHTFTGDFRRIEPGSLRREVLSVLAGLSAQEEQ